MVLAYHDIASDQPNLAHQLQTIPKLGTPRSRLTLLASKTLNVIYRSGDLSDLQAAVESGVPPIALVRTDQLSYWQETTFHAVVVTGFDEESLFLNDPGSSNEDARRESVH